MAWSGKPWNSLRTMVTTQGVYCSVYHPGGEGEWVEVLAPDGASHRLNTPGLLDWQLASIGGKLSVYYNRDEGDGRKALVAVHSAVPCGEWAGLLVAGGTGPMGPAGAPGPAGERGEDGRQGPPGPPGQAQGGADVSEEQMQRIAALTAEQVLLGPPAGDHFGLPENARFGTRHQEAIAVMFTNQAFLQEFIKALDEGALGLVAGGYQPKVK